MTYDWVTENARINAENERRQEAWRQERLQRDLIAEQRRANDIAQRQANSGNGILGLLLLGLVIAGIMWVVIWFVGVIWRLAGRKNNSQNTPTNHENELLGLLRRHGIDPNDVAAGVRETLRRQGKR